MLAFVTIMVRPLMPTKEALPTLPTTLLQLRSLTTPPTSLQIASARSTFTRLKPTLPKPAKAEAFENPIVMRSAVAEPFDNTTL